ncbi:DUF6367 family protein [Burkholderia pseudomallei]|uniref:DUF6367 family protein n=1 Tax=Burkholderia pseudomallei TaxID=28450 RepID=UPI0011C4C50A|nr:DUF6367 family protein [Burkholderia pseudomallei]
MTIFERAVRELPVPDHLEEIFVRVSEEFLSSHILALEGRWERSDIPGWEYRLDYNQPTHPAQRHVHIRKEGANGREVSWNDNGTRHDKHSFDDRLAAKKQAQAIARSVLKISINIALEDERAIGGESMAHVRFAEEGKQAYVTFG